MTLMTDALHGVAAGVRAAAAEGAFRDAPPGAHAALEAMTWHALVGDPGALLTPQQALAL